MSGTFLNLLRCGTCLGFILLISASLTWSKSVHERRKRTTTTTEIANFTTLVGPRNPVDLVLIMDRSKGIGKERFYLEEMPLIRAILQQFVTIHPDYARIAGITFAKDSTQVFDHISSDYINKCEFFEAANPSWDTIRYVDTEVAPGTNLKDSMIRALEIFEQGKINRPSAKQVLLVITDGDYKIDEDPYQPLAELRTRGVTIFSLGLGPWLEIGSVRSLASDPLYFGYFEDWRNLLRAKPSSLSSDSSYLLVSVSQSYCKESCEKSACFCDVDRGVSLCQCNAGYTPMNYPDGSNCTACEINQYKSSVGNQLCSECPLSFTSFTETKGSTSKDDCICSSNDCTDPCEPNPCNGNQYCTIDSTDKSPLCRCLPGWEGADCSVNSPTCDTNLCQNGATCYDGVDDYTCVCASGFKGRYCEINIDECRYELCLNGANCEDQVNNFNCACVGKYEGRFCEYEEKPTTTTTRAPSTTPQSTTPSTAPPTTPSPSTPATPSPSTPALTTPTTTRAPTTPKSSAGSTTEKPTQAPQPTPQPTQPSEDTTTPSRITESTKKPTGAPATGEDDDNMIIIIGAAAGGGALLIIIILIIVCCCCCRKNKDETENPPERAASISQKFDGLWRGKTVRAGKSKSYIDTITPISGLPSVPKRRPDLLGHMSEMEQGAKEVEEAYLSNTTITLSRSMGGWTKYIKELEEGNIVEECLIAKLTNEEHAKSKQWYYSWEEVYNLYNVMERQESNLPVHVQGGEYQVHRNDGVVLEASSIGSMQKAAKLAIGVTKNYMIVAIADAYSDEGKLAREVQWITDHIQTEGY